jgi:hypothetical protein
MFSSSKHGKDSGGKLFMDYAKGHGVNETDKNIYKLDRHSEISKFISLGPRHDLIELNLNIT